MVQLFMLGDGLLIEVHLLEEIIIQMCQKEI